MQANLKQTAVTLANKLNALGFTKDGRPMVIDQAYELVAAVAGFRNQHILRKALPEVEAQVDAVRYRKLRGWASSNVPEGWKQVERFGSLCAWQSWEDADGYLDSLPWCNVGLMGNSSPEAAGVKSGAAELLQRIDHDQQAIAVSTHESNTKGEASWESTVNAQGWNEESRLIHLEGFLREKGLFGEFAVYAARAAEEENGEAEDCAEDLPDSEDAPEESQPAALRLSPALYARAVSRMTPAEMRREAKFFGLPGATSAWPFDFRQALIQRYDAERERVADEAFENWDFGTQLESSGWTKSETSWTRPVFLENDEGPSTRVSFTVEFNGCALDAASCSNA